MRTLRGRRLDGDVEDEIREKALLGGWNAAQIRRYLLEKCQGAERNKVPDIRTIRHRVSEYAVEDESGPWTLAEAEGEEAALVLPVLGVVLERTEARIAGFTKEQARWIAKVRRAAPDLDAWYVWEVAAACQVAVDRDREADVASLDALLAFAPWRSLGATERFLQWARHHRPDWFSLPRFIIVPAGRPFDANKDVRPVGNVAGLFIAQKIELDLVRGQDIRRDLAPKREEGAREPPGQP